MAILGGVVIGLMGSFTHQSVQPWGAAIALSTVALYLSGLRAWGDDRGPAGAGAIGIAGVSAILAAPGADGSIVIPANAAGYSWSLGLVLVALIVLAWPRVQRPHRRPTSSIETTAPDRPEEKDPTAP